MLVNPFVKIVSIESLVTLKASLLLHTLQYGMVWMIFAMSIITINDIAAYMCGFFFGSRNRFQLNGVGTVWDNSDRLSRPNGYHS